MSRIIVTGPKSSGKSSIGQRLAQLRKLQFYDLDEQIEKLFEEEGKVLLSFREIFKRHGEEKFRELELNAVKSLAETDKVIISTGGTTFFREEARNLLLKNSNIILLYNSAQKLWERTVRKGMPSYLEGEQDPETAFYKRVNDVIDLVRPFAVFELDTRDLSVEDVAQMLDLELEHRKIEI